MKAATFLAGLLALVLTLIWVIVMAGTTMLDGGYLAGLPLTVSLYVSWKLFRIVRWVWNNEERFELLANLMSNFAFVLQTANEKQPAQMKQLFKQLSVPPEQFQQ